MLEPIGMKLDTWNKHTGDLFSYIIRTVAESCFCIEQCCNQGGGSIKNDRGGVLGMRFFKPGL